MPLSLQIPSAPPKRRKSLNDSPTTATQTSPLINTKLSESFSSNSSSSKRAQLSPTTATQTGSPTLLIPPSPEALSRRGSFMSESEALPSDIYLILQTLPFFAGASSTDAFIQDIGNAMKIRHFKPGDSVIRYGDTAKCMFLIIKGELAVMSEDNEIEFAVLTSGSFVGEIGVLFNIVRTANVTSKTKSILAALTLDVLDRTLEKYPDIKELLHIKGKERLAALEQIKQKGKGSHEVMEERPKVVSIFFYKKNELFYSYFNHLCMIVTKTT
jgi:CRP-like cAMP-binding protein